MTPTANSMIVWVAVIVLVTLSGGQCDADVPHVPVVIPGDSLVAKQLYHSTIPIRNFTYPKIIRKLGCSYTAELSNTECKFLQFSSIVLDVFFPTNPIFSGFINGFDLQFNCTTHAHLTAPGFLCVTQDADISLTVGAGSSLSIALDAYPIDSGDDTPLLPTAAHKDDNLVEQQMVDALTAVMGERIGDIAANTMQKTTENPLPKYLANMTSCDFNVTVTYYNAGALTALLDAELVEDIVRFGMCNEATFFVAETMSEVINSVIDLLWQLAISTEDPDPFPIFNREAFYWAFGSAAVICIATVALCVLVDGRIHNEKYRPLMLSKRLHWILRFGMFSSIVFTIALFVSSLLSVGASVYLYITIRDQRGQLPSMYQFTLISSVIEMWEAGVWQLSLLVGITSGVWPYVKLIFMFFCWVFPPILLPLRWRRGILVMLDITGKWSLIDAFVLVLFMEAFHVALPIPFLGFSLHMISEPQYAYYAYLAATMISLALSHVILELHHSAEDPPLPDSAPSIAIAHKYATNSASSPRYMSCTFVGAFFVYGLIAITLACVVWGSIVHSFTMSYDGSLIGFIMGLTGQPQTYSYSIWSLTASIPATQMDDPNNVGIRVMQATFILFVFIMPVIHLIWMALVWIMPNNVKIQHYTFLFLEVCNAWSSLDVFIVAFIVALLQLEQFADFLIKDRCDVVDPFLKIILQNPDATCFNVRADLLDGCWISAAAIGLWTIVSWFITPFLNRVMTERVERARRQITLAREDAEQPRNMYSHKIRDETDPILEADETDEQVSWCCSGIFYVLYLMFFTKLVGRPQRV